MINYGRYDDDVNLAAVNRVDLAGPFPKIEIKSNDHGKLWCYKSHNDLKALKQRTEWIRHDTIGIQFNDIDSDNNR